MENNFVENATLDDSSVTLRPVTPEDDAFLLEVYASTRMSERPLVQHWDESQWDAFIRMQFNAQRHDYTKRFPDSEHSIVLRDGTPVGRIWIERNEGEIRLIDVVILPQYQNAGIGTTLLRRLAEESDRDGKPLRDMVEKINPRALSLYQRMGFSITGEIPTHFVLERPPAAK